MSDSEESAIEALELMFENLLSPKSIGTDIEPLQKLMAHLGIEKKHWPGRKQSYLRKVLRQEKESQESIENEIAILNRINPGLC